MDDGIVNEITDVRRMRASWDRGINYLVSFYTMLDAKRKEIGDEALRDWCFHELRISLSILIRISEVLEDADKARVREELARAAEFDRQKKREEKRQADEEKHAAAVADAERKLAHLTRLRELAEDAQKQKEAADKAKGKTSKGKTNNKTGGGGGSGGGARKPRQSKKRANPNPDVNDMVPDPAVASALGVINNFVKKFTSLRAEWVDASLVLAEKLREARTNYPADQEFGKWLDTNDLRQIRDKDRGALIEMGADLKAARKAFDDNPNSVSWQLVWRGRFVSVNKPSISEQNQEDSDNVVNLH